MEQIEKIRIGKAYDFKNSRDLYQLQFKVQGERTYRGLSFDMFEKLEDAKKALAMHESGEREYKYMCSQYKNKKLKKRVEDRIAFLHIFHAKPLSGSIIWVKQNLEVV